MEPYIGQILLIAWDWAPRGWALCHGQLLSIPQNSALYSLLGTTYGGDGRNSFALPDLRGRAPIHQGVGTNLSPRTMGESGGLEDVTLLVENLPQHTHPAVVSSQGAGRNGTFLAAANLTNSGPNDLLLATSTIGFTGNNIPHQNMQPYLVMNYIIALEGIYPPRP
jgi:microcystin-dependent protein